MNPIFLVIGSVSGCPVMSLIQDVPRKTELKEIHGSWQKFLVIHSIDFGLE